MIFELKSNKHRVTIHEMGEYNLTHGVLIEVIGVSSRIQGCSSKGAAVSVAEDIFKSLEKTTVNTRNDW